MISVAAEGCRHCAAHSFVFLAALTFRLEEERTPVPATPCDSELDICARGCRLNLSDIDHWEFNVIMSQLLKDFSVGNHGHRGVQST